MHHDSAIAVDRPAQASLIARAIAAGAPESVAAEALRVTRNRFPGRAAGSPASGRRAEAYFWGVVRRRALQGAAPVMSRRIVIASLERELRDAGHAPEAIRREIARLYGVDALPVDEVRPEPERSFA